MSNPNTLALIVEHGIMVRQIPVEVVSKYGYYEGFKLAKGQEIIEENGRKYVRSVKYPTNGGKWMAKQCTDSGSTVKWYIKTDNLSDTIDEAVQKAVDNIITK